jgi:hypothetical protein
MISISGATFSAYKLTYKFALIYEDEHDESFVDNGDER